jgi:hypothetical protein
VQPDVGNIILPHFSELKEKRAIEDRLKTTRKLIQSANALSDEQEVTLPD